MFKKRSVFLTLLLFMNLLTSCSLTNRHSLEENHLLFSSMTAKKFPEMRLLTVTGDQHMGKILRLDRGKVIFLTFPYWNVEPVEISVGEIFRINLMKKSRKVIKGGILGLSSCFCTIGLILGVNAKYDVHYEDCLILASTGGVIGALTGFITGGIFSIGEKTKFNFFNMSQDKKIKTLKKIMGL